MTASRWPMRCSRSSAWSCIAGVHSSSRNATFDARVSVKPCAATRVAPTSSCGPSLSWNARTVASRSGDGVAPHQVQRRRGKRSSTASCTSTWRAKTTSGSPLARKSWIHASAACSLPVAASRWSVVSCASRSARSVARDLRVELGEVQRLLAQPRDHVLLGQPVLAARCRARSARTTWRLAGSCGSTSCLSRRTKQCARRCQCRRSSSSVALELAGEARAAAEVLEPPEHAQLADQLLGVVEHRRPGQREPQRRRPAARPASRRTACVRLARGFLA